MALPCLNEAPDSNNPRRSGSEAEEFETEVSRALIVFARLPVLGKVKTRLAAGVGTEAACEFYKACAEHVIQEAGRYEEGLWLILTCASFAGREPYSRLRFLVCTAQVSRRAGLLVLFGRGR